VEKTQKVQAGQAGKDGINKRAGVSRRPSLAVRLASVLLGTLLGAGLLEVALRAAPQIMPAKVLLHFSAELRLRFARGRFLTRDQVRLVPRDDGGPHLWILKPHGQKPYNFDDEGIVKLVTYDDIGFCNADGRYKNEPDFDIIAIGDSFTACHAVLAEDTWSLRIEDLLDTSVYNLGAGGTGLSEHLQLLQTFGLPRDPKIVIMNVYEGNDLRDALRFHAAREGLVTELDEATQSQNDKAGWKRTWLGRHSYAVNFVFALAERLSELWSRYDAQRDLDFRYDLVFEDRRVAMNPANQDTFEVVNGRQLESGEISLDVFDEALQRLLELSKQHDFTPVVTYSPSAQTAYADVVEFHDPSVAGPVQLLSDRQRDYFERKSRELELEFLDLTPHLREAAATKAEELLYFPTTLHYTRYAHDVVARAIADLLEDLGLATPTGTASAAG
jgi:hypothetical protein